MTTHKKFIFVRPFTCDMGTIPVNSELIILKQAIYFNGGIIQPQFYELFHALIDDEMVDPYYLKEVPIPYNKV